VHKWPRHDPSRTTGFAGLGIRCFGQADPRSAGAN